MRAIEIRTREIEADEREAASALILGTCAGHGMAYCDASPPCLGPLVGGQGFAMHCGGRGRDAVKCETLAAFAAAQQGRSPYTQHGNDSERTARTRS